ncbi:MAG: hypothetical protein ACI9P5_002825 [Saprospiraceae bacterium]|jgi:hypothetical protein|tara:strand:+ start:392 stop:571 length:180 start_codon:yes stop_codon:yes gene_type:complete
MAKKNEKKQKPNVHEELDGFNIKINAFGEMETTIPIEKLNAFLNQNVEDKKLGSGDEEE